METKLKCIIIDDEPEVHSTIIGFLKNSEKAIITHSFYKCSEFFEKMDFIPFDVAILDCWFPGDSKQGADVALKLKELGKHFIFISGQTSVIIEAVRLFGAVDVMPKPLNELRFLEAIDTAFKIIKPKPDKSVKHILVHVKGKKGLVSITIKSILYAKPETEHSSNKIVRMKNNINYTIMDYTFNDLLNLSPEFSMANKYEMVNYGNVEGISEGYVQLYQNKNNAIPEKIPLSPIYQDNFKRLFH